MIVDDGNDLLALLVFVPRVPNPIPPFLATVLVPSPWSTLISSCFSTARCRTLATNACQSDHHQPIWQRLCRRSCSEWPACLGCRVEWASPSTASLCRAPTG